MRIVSIGWFALLTIRLPLLAGTFEEKIRPILNSNCMPCHDERTRTSGFSVKDLQSVLAGGSRRGPAVKPRSASQSPLIQLLRGEIKPQMPPGRKLTAEEIDGIETWINELPVEIAGPDKPVAKRYWAFIPPRKPSIPATVNASWARNEIDHFVLQKLEEKGLSPSEEASPRLLIRRLYFDLLGLPPSPEHVKAFVDDRSPSAYERLVDCLLSDSRYGERWGRHWLDLARYADTNGYEGDPEWPHAWRYRDYVIDAFNSDKPYDEFIKEQIAGDEFFQVVSAVPALPPEPEKNVALTFLRLAPFNRTPVSDENRDSLLSEMTSTVSSVFLGLTVGCAKCHDHKYDMVPTRDFYRMKAFFASVQITNTGRAGGMEPAEFYRPGEKERIEKARSKHKADLKATETEFTEFQRPLLGKLAAALRREKPKEEKPVTEKDLERAMNPDASNAAGFDKKEEVFTAEEKEKYAALTERISRLKKSIERVEPLAMALRNADGPPFGPSVPTTHVLVRGEYDRPGEAVEPGFLSAITGNSEPAALELDRYKMFPTRGRRMTLAKWIASPENPLTARVMVNRLWQHHFGRGIVETASDFGKNGTPPTHPELLDWLATKFIEEKWSMKAMHRIMLTSAAYRQSSKRMDEKAAQADPDNRLLWRFNRLRLEGEAVRDSVLAVSGRLNSEMGGPPVYPPLPGGLDTAQKVQNVNTWETSYEDDGRKRSIYIFQRRALNLPFLETFDAPVFNASCDRRRTSITALQALSMYDSDFVNAEARYFAERVRQETGPDPSEHIERAFQIAFGRNPNAVEKQDARVFVDSRKDALAGLCRVLLNSNEFIYVD